MRFNLRYILFISCICIPMSLPGKQFNALVFADLADKYHHPCVPVIKESFDGMAKRHAFGLTIAETADAFAKQNFAEFDVIVLISGSPTKLDEAKRKEFQAYVKGGGGIVGVHFCFAFEEAPQWPWWEQLIGRTFKSHPPIQSGVLTNHDPEFPACMHLPDKWLWTDEWYSFETPFPDHLNVLLSVDEQSYHPRPQDAMGNPHPIAWYHEPYGAKVFYTAIGHIPITYKDPGFLQHIFGAMLWAVGERDPKW
jgi:type 1 glutamine amidotransferase